MIGYCSKNIENSVDIYLDNIERTFCQSTGCRLNLSMSIFSTLRNTVIIIHAPLGCGAANTSFMNRITKFQKLKDKDADGPIWISTNLDELDSINGGESKLEETILYAENKFRPENIIILNSCVPALIGDDIEGIISQIQEETEAKIILINCEGFKPRKMEKPFDAIYKGMLNNLPNNKSKINGENLKVNLLNTFQMSMADEDELIRLLRGIGLKVKAFPCYSRPNEIEDILDAALNISVTNADDYFVQYIETEYGIPYVLKNVPKGIEGTNEWIRDIAGNFGLEERAEKFIDKENKELLKALKPFKGSLAGKTALLIGGSIRTFAMTELLDFLEIRILDINGGKHSSFTPEGIEELINNEENRIFDMMTAQSFEKANIIERLKPDICIGGIGGTEHGIPSFSIFGQDQISMGYSGVFEAARKLNRIFKNTSFSKNIGKNSKSPYRVEWYEKNPFSYRDDFGKSSGSI